MTKPTEFKKVRIMGVLNVTPDSFSDGGKYNHIDSAVCRALTIEREGADIIDVGGESSRPGASIVPLDEEIKRVVPLVKELKQILKIPISVDTYKSKVAQLALEAGAKMINDITGLTQDADMATVIKEYGAEIVIMHMQGTPRNMQKDPKYDNVLKDIYSFLDEAIEKAVGSGVKRDKIIIDPGIGFGKTLNDNLTILKNISFFKKLNLPILIGSSRKSFIGEIIDKGVEDRLMGTASSVAISIMNGANIVRVHDVKEMLDVVSIADAIVGAKTK